MIYGKIINHFPHWFHSEAEDKKANAIITYFEASSNTFKSYIAPMDQFSEFPHDVSLEDLGEEAALLSCFSEWHSVAEGYHVTIAEIIYLAKEECNVVKLARQPHNFAEILGFSRNGEVIAQGLFLNTGVMLDEEEPIELLRHETGFTQIHYYNESLVWPQSFRPNIRGNRKGHDKEIRKPEPWKHSQPITREQLNQMREKFWDSVGYDERKDIWDALRDVVEEDSMTVAQIILDNAGVVVQNHDLTVCFDERGEKYELPLYVLSEPTNLVQDK